MSAIVANKDDQWSLNHVHTIKATLIKLCPSLFDSENTTLTESLTNFDANRNNSYFQPTFEGPSSQHPLTKLIQVQKCKQIHIDILATSRIISCSEVARYAFICGQWRNQTLFILSPKPSDNHVTQKTTLLINVPGNISLWEFPAKILKVQLKTLNHFDSVNSILVKVGQTLNRDFDVKLWECKPTLIRQSKIIFRGR